MTRRLLILAFALSVLALSNATGAATYKLIDLGVPKGYVASEADRINNKNEVTGELTTPGERPNQGFIWHSGKMRVTKTLHLINNKGDVLIETDTQTDQGSAYFVCAGKRVSFPVFGDGRFWPGNMNDRGMLCGCCAYEYRSIAAVWANGSTTSLGALDKQGDSFAHAVNDHGQVVGTSGYAKGLVHAFFWQNDKMTDIGTLDGCTQSEGHDINNAAQVVAWACGPKGWDTGNGDLRSFVWRLDRPTGLTKTVDLGALHGGNRTKALAINNSGQVVGRASVSNHNIHAFLWKNGAMKDLGTLPGGVYSTANDINDKGWIVGSATNAEGAEHAVIWKPVTAK